MEIGIKEFKVVTVSSNTNSFGLYGVIIMAKDGQTYQIATGSLYKPEKGQILDATINIKSGFLNSINGISYEIPEKLQNAPANVIKQVWSESYK